MLRSTVLILTCLTSPTSGAASDADDVWGLALSGNGMLAMAHGAGVIKALTNGGYSDKITSVSSVSGGSWLNTLFAYSSSFYDGLLSESTSIDKFYEGFLYEFMARGQQVQPTECMQRDTPMNCWADFIGQAIYPSDVTSLQATGQNRLQRNVFDGAELLIASNIPTKSLMTDQSTTTILDYLYWTYSSRPLELPTYYTIGATNSNQLGTWTVPFGLGDFPMVQDARGREAALQLPTNVTVSYVGAASSAANGAGGAPEIKEGSKPATQFCTFFPCPSKNDENVAESAICSDPSQGATCSFPSVRFMDGCYSENLGLAVNIGHLQKKHPGKQLNFFVANSNNCGVGADGSPSGTDADCIEATHESTFRNLFSGSPYPETSSEGWIFGGTGISVPTINRVIFAEQISDEQALGTKGTGNVTVVKGTFTTVENKLFGVSAGTKVKLVVFSSNSIAPLQPAQPEDITTLSAVAKDTFDTATSVVEALTAESNVVVV